MTFDDVHDVCCVQVYENVSGYGGHFIVACTES